MAKDQLMVVEDREGYRFRLQWWLAESEDMGLTLGEGGPNVNAAEVDPETAIAYGIVLKEENLERDSRGWYWESKTQAMSVLSKIKVAWKVEKANKANQPWPHWAVQALEAGWKPPKGWMPCN